MKAGDKVQDVDMPIAIGTVVQVTKDSITVRAGCLVRYTHDEARQYLKVIESKDTQMKMEL